MAPEGVMHWVCVEHVLGVFRKMLKQWKQAGLGGGAVLLLGGLGYVWGGEGGKRFVFFVVGVGGLFWECWMSV